MTAPTPPPADTATSQRRILNRLKRARGQLNALIESFEAGADCRSAVTQLAAVTSALDKAGFAIIAAAMRNCAIAEATSSASADAHTTPTPANADAHTTPTPANADAHTTPTAPAQVDDATAHSSAKDTAPNTAPLTQAELEKLFLSLT